MLGFRHIGATLVAAGCFNAPFSPAMADVRPTPSAFTAGANAQTMVYRSTKAPADEYFGRFKLSILGVRNTIADSDARAQRASDADAANLSHKLIIAEDALRDWQTKYPNDSWVPRFGYAMLNVYEKLESNAPSDDSAARVHAIDLASWLEAKYPNSEFAPH